jgi:hypothetical protein
MSNSIESGLRFLFLRDPAGRALRLKFITEEFAFTGFARFQGKRLAVWGDDTFDFSKIGEKRLVLHRQLVSHKPPSNQISGNATNQALQLLTFSNFILYRQ